ncbi:F-box only protein 21-like [Linepithema humile]|uniref:F-box only protein 21-like n=1 Tax=Linepithema humile TaxID=83485 RepID=UPI00351DD8DC
MATVMSLPPEVINIILCKENVSIKDIVSFARTCKRFNNIINDNVLWRKKFYQRWPYLREEYDKQLCKENFLEQVKAGIKFKKQLWHYMSLMPKKRYYKDDSFDVGLKNFHSLFDPDKGAYFMNYYFFVNELKLRILPAKEFRMKYEAHRFLSYLHLYCLKIKWHKFVNYCKQKQILEEAATILAQCYEFDHSQEYMSYMYMRTSLDNIAQQVLEYLKNKYPAHPIFSISAEQFSFWKYNNIDDNHWNSTEGRQILESLCKVLQNKLSSYENYKKCKWPEERKRSFTPEDFFIHFVLENKCGTGLPLAIIFHSVARRLGVRCDLASFPFRFLCWRPKFLTTNLKDEECFYIDVLRCESRQSSNDGSMIISATKMHPKELRLLRSEFEDEKKCRLAIMPLISELEHGAIIAKRNSKNKYDIVLRLLQEFDFFREQIKAHFMI